MDELSILVGVIGVSLVSVAAYLRSQQEEMSRIREKGWAAPKPITNLTANYEQLHEEVKLLHLKMGDEMFVEMSDKEKEVWAETAVLPLPPKEKLIDE